MNYKHAFFALALLSFWAGAYQLRAQDLSVVSTNGTVSVLDLSTIESIVFTNNNLVIHSTDCEDNYHSLFFTEMLSFDAVNSTTEVSGSTDALLLYPNPAGDILMIERHSETIENGKIYTVTGELIRCFTATSSVQELSVKELPAGVYFISLDNQLSKFLKQ